MRLRALRTLAQAQNGATAVEVAVTASVFLALLFGAIEFGRALWTQQALQETATAGARCMALPQSNCATANYTYSPTNTISYIKQVAAQWGISLTDPNIDLRRRCLGMTGLSEVRLSFTFASVVAGLVNIPSGGIPLSATACFPNNPGLVPTP